MATETMQLCTFGIHGYTFGVNVECVQEVIRAQRITRVPLLSNVVKGLINLRGQIVTAIDLRGRLGFPERADGKPPMNVVVRIKDNALVSLLVDEIGDVIEVTQDQFEPPPPTTPHKVLDVLDRFCVLDDRLLLVLDAERLVSIADQNSQMEMMV